MLTYLNISLSVNIRWLMVKVIKLMIRKSNSGKKYYRYTMPISNELFEKAGFKETDNFVVESKNKKLIIKSKKY
jgi:hypothetical protein